MAGYERHTKIDTAVSVASELSCSNKIQSILASSAKSIAQRLEVDAMHVDSSWIQR